MGVPGFFLWLWKRYKGSNFVFSKGSLDLTKECDIETLEKINSIDEFLLDLNCAIHPMCFQVLAENPNLKNFETLENKMMNRVIEYIDELVTYVNPQKVVYLAIDGVAPVAKIKQQRSRRFKSVHDRVLFDNIKKKHKKEIGIFWNNSAITPGTVFMDKLKKKIIQYCQETKEKRGIKMIFSTSNTPAEGEHKLLQYIRNKQRSKVKDDHKYVIYGLDADLIFLALSTNKDDIFLLREAVHLDSGNTKNFDSLNYVAIDVMKSCIYKQISSKILDNIADTEEDNDIILKKTNIINDFIFICYLLGNDFLPHIPSLDITKNGIDILIKKYSETWSNLYDYCVDATLDDFSINSNFLSMLLYSLACEEDDILIKKYHKKPYRRRCESTDPYDRELHRIDNLHFKVVDPIKLGLDNSEQWTLRYYKHYFHLTQKDEYFNFSKKVCEEYFIGLMWVSKYYFNECKSWDWYFPFDHAPFIKEMAQHCKTFDFNNVQFQKGVPLKPFMQLLSVLPSQSSYLLPEGFKKIMKNNNSSIAQLYPYDFQQDFLYKNRYWQGIPLLPALEIDLIKSMYSKYKKKLTIEEQSRNKVIENYVF
jgi:5'-3' exonuclease